MTSEAEYQLFLSQANTMMERRQIVTTTYLSVNAAIIAALAFLFKDGQLGGILQQVSALLLLGTGIVACGIWRRLISQYRILLGWWYEQLRAIESTLEGSSGLLQREYDQLYGAGSGIAKVGLTRDELRLIWLITAVYAIAFLGIAVAIIT